MAVLATRGRLTFPSEELELDLRLQKTLRWEQPPVEREDLSNLRQNASALRKILLNASPSAESLNFLQRRAEARIRSIVDNWPNMALLPENWTEQLTLMIGLGPGLTPLGDDFVSGYLVAACLLAPSDELRRELRESSVLFAAGKTTFYSQQQILFAGQGFCLRSIFLLIRSLALPDFDHTKVTPVLNIGATSGYGWLWGISVAASQVCR
jgi:hypothetical protein